MDGVNIVMEVEEAFDIRIDDAEAQACETVGQLVALVKSKLGTPERQVCHSARAFYSLRRFLTTTTGLERAWVRRESPTDALFSAYADDLRLAWRGASDHTGLALPQLDLPRWGQAVVGVGCLSVVSVVVVAILAAWGSTRPPWLALAAIASSIVAFVLLWWFMDRFRWVLPAGLATVGALASETAVRNFRQLSSLIGGWGPDDIASTVRYLVANELGVPIERATDEARFIQDLGMN